jgi:hypothetical protein
MPMKRKKILLNIIFISKGILSTTVTDYKKKHKNRRAWTTQNRNYERKYARTMLPKMRAL